MNLRIPMVIKRKFNLGLRHWSGRFELDDCANVFISAGGDCTMDAGSQHGTELLQPSLDVGTAVDPGAGLVIGSKVGTVNC